MLKTRMVNAVFYVAIIAGLAVMFLVILPILWKFTDQFTNSSPKLANTPAILQQVQSLSHLITVKYVMEKVIDLPDTKWYGENRVLMIGHGIVMAGIDLSEMKDGDIVITGNKVSIKLPPARAPMDFTKLDDKQTKIVERTTGLLRTFDKDLEQNAREAAVLDINRAAREAGILKDADERARGQLKVFFTRMGFKEEDISFRSP